MYVILKVIKIVIKLIIKLSKIIDVVEGFFLVLISKIGNNELNNDESMIDINKVIEVLIISVKYLNFLFDNNFLVVVKYVFNFVILIIVNINVSIVVVNNFFKIIFVKFFLLILFKVIVWEILILDCKFIFLILLLSIGIIVVKVIVSDVVNDVLLVVFCVMYVECNV